MIEGEPAKKGLYPLAVGIYVRALFAVSVRKWLVRRTMNEKWADRLHCTALHCWNTYSKSVRCDRTSTTPRDESTKKEGEQNTTKIVGR
jgi:hypothetical protein